MNLTMHEFDFLEDNALKLSGFSKLTKATDFLSNDFELIVPMASTLL